MERETRPAAQVESMLGAAVHVDVGTMVVQRAMRLAGLDEKGDVRYGDACSGVGTVAAAVDRVTAGRMKYVFAAENDKDKRDVLMEAWEGRGLKRGRMYWDACDTVKMMRAPKVDIYALTANCKAFSRMANMTPDEKRVNGTKEECAQSAIADVRAMLAYVEAQAPQVVIIESVSELLEGHAAQWGDQIKIHAR